MTELIEALDGFTAKFLQGYTGINSKLWGFCELANRTSPPNGKIQPTVITINGTTDRKPVTLDDRYNFISWVRIPGTARFVDSPEWSFGFKESRFQSVDLRWVIAHRVELGENLIYSIADALPEQFGVSNFQFVFVNPTGFIDHDHEAIYKTELGDTVYEKHRFPWNLYVINLTLEFIACEGFVYNPCGRVPITADNTEITVDNA